MYGIVLVLMVLNIVVFFHELGHFLLAKWCGMYVETFSIGFGKMLFKKRIGETTYAFSLVPLGGYVKFIEEAGGVRQFGNKPVWQRVLVVLAGPAFNFFLAAAILTAIGMFIGTPTNVVQIRSVEENSPAASAQLLPGDRIYGAHLENKNRNEGEFTSEISLYEFLTRVKNSAGEPVRLFVKRHATSAEPLFFEVVVMPKQTNENVWAIGVLLLSPLENIGETSAAWGIHETKRQIDATFVGIWDTITGHVSPQKGLSGPIGIVTFGSRFLQQGTSVTLLHFTAMLSIALGVFNLLPIPALDGGHLPLLLLEGIRRKSLPLWLRNGWQIAGLAVVLVILFTTTYFDISRLFSK